MGRAPQSSRVDEREGSDGGVGLRPVDERDPFLRCEHDRRQLHLPHHRGRGARAASSRQLAFTDQRQREMGQRRQIAARAHAALLGDLGVQLGVEHAYQEIHDVRPAAGMAFGKHVGTQDHHRAHFPHRKWRPDASRVASHQIDLELCEPVVGDRDVGQLAEPGGHSVHDVPTLDNGVHDGPRALHARARGRSHTDQGAIRDREHVLDHKRITIEHNGCRHPHNVGRHTE